MQFMRKISLILTSLFCVHVLNVANASEVVDEQSVKVAVANSLCGAMKEAANLYEKKHEATLRFICKSSGRLAKGLNGKAISADIYISASNKWMSYAVDKKLVDKKQVISPWGNKLAVAAPVDSDVELKDIYSLKSPTVKRILIGDPSTAPFGRHAKEVLKASGVWKDVRPKIQTRKHITLLANDLVAADRSTVGILFVSNLVNEHRHLLDVPSSLHSSIRYYVAPLQDASSNESVKQFLTFLQTNQVRGLLENNGFKVFGR